MCPETAPLPLPQAAVVGVGVVVIAFFWAVVDAVVSYVNPSR